MIKKLFLLLFWFYVMTLFQTSFLVHFAFFGAVPNLVLIALLIIAMKERANSHLGFHGAWGGGFFLDIFSSKPFGFWVGILLILFYFVSFLKQRYVRTISV